MSNFLSSDVYEITQLIEDIKTRNMGGVSSLTLAMSIFGYFSEISSAMMQSAVVMASEYSNEAIPVKAKFEKNIITHALALGIEKLNAQPAVVELMLSFPEDIIIANMVNNRITLDKDMQLFINGYEYHLDYDVVITRTKLLNGEYVYTAQYDIKRKNPISNITNPYLPPIGRIMITNTPMISVEVQMHQVEYTKVYKKILTSNPLENKIINFEFENQLAAFDLEVVENSNNYYLTPVYDGLVDYDSRYYCNYNYMNTNAIRIKFDPASYMPKVNADVTINLYTSHGSEANFTYAGGSFTWQFNSDRIKYNKLYASILVMSPSNSGIDRKSVKELKRLIPKEALARGSVTSSTDLNNYFNSINTDDIKLLFFKKIDNALERLYYSFLLMRVNNIIVPTNTISIDLIRSNFDNINNKNYVFNNGNMIYYTGNKNATVENHPSDEKLKEYEDTGFVYMNPFVCVINKSPFYISYYLTRMNIDKFLNFDYINQASQNQFVASTINWKREFFTDKDKYKLNIKMSQNILSDMNLVNYDDKGKITGANVKVALVLYNSDDEPYRYKFAEFKKYYESNYVFEFEVSLQTDDVIDDLTSRIRINDMKDIGTVTTSYGYFNKKTKAKLFIYVVNQDGEEAGRKDADKIIPSMEVSGYALSNIYEVYDGIDFFYNYSHIMNSTIKVAKRSDTSLLYTVNKMPVIRYSYMNTEEKFQEFIRQLEIRRHYIESCLDVLEDSFGIDFKFFNTYGPSKLFSVTGDPTRLDRVNLTLKFRCSLTTQTNKYIKQDIISLIKEYVEDINNGIANLHMPNLVTEITNKYREQILFFEFREINDYGTAYKHIYRPDESLINKIPEFLCINTLEDGTPDINIEFV